MRHQIRYTTRVIPRREDTEGPHRYGRAYPSYIRTKLSRLMHVYGAELSEVLLEHPGVSVSSLAPLGMTAGHVRWP